MTSWRLDENTAETVDTVLRHWRQGDCVLGQQWFTFRFDPKQPITAHSTELQGEGDSAEIAEVEVEGFVVLTQTCDIVRNCSSRPFVEIAPLIKVHEIAVHEIDKGLRPQYAAIPALTEKHLVADLDRVMTVEKAVLVGWERVSGCQSVQQARKFSQALSRKRSRFAFPDDFVHFSKKLQERLQKKHDKMSDEGDALRSLREIRVRAAPSWNAEHIEVFFWFIRNNDSIDFAGEGWDLWLEKWLCLLPSSDRFRVGGVVLTLDDITAREYVESDPLDLDHLSS